MMKRHFDVESDGFYGAYWKCKTGSDCAMIGDDPESSDTLENTPTGLLSATTVSKT